jgi:hypothetical protein
LQMFAAEGYEETYFVERRGEDVVCFSRETA